MTSEARCTKCYATLQPGAKFCGRCGAEVKPPETQARSAAGECPSCGHRNALDASFCESCGTQLSRAAEPAGQSYRPPQTGDSPQSGTHHAAPPSEDPWATGPGYERPLDPDSTCPRCGEFRSADETACANCGLPFGRRVNADGVPAAVARCGTPAGFWIRLVAVIIDGIIIAIIGFLLGQAGIGFGVEAFNFEGGDGEVLSFEIDLFSYVLSLIYGSVLLSLFGTTAGKKIFNIYVYSPDGKTPLSFPRAFLRELSKFLSSFILLIGYIIAAFRKDKRALHDLIAGTFPTKG